MKQTTFASAAWNRAHRSQTGECDRQMSISTPETDCFIRRLARDLQVGKRQATVGNLNYGPFRIAMDC
jgi:hypothetical protein